MKKSIAPMAILLLLSVVLLVACSPSYVVDIKKQVEAQEEPEPITLEKADEVQASANNAMTVITFVVTDKSISVDKVVNFYKFYPGAQGDVLYMIRNEGTVPIKPIIMYNRDARIDDYSAVEGQGFFDAPSFVPDWITITPPETKVLQPGEAQGYIVNLAMPKEVQDFPSNWAFNLGVAHGASVYVRASTWWLIHMR